LALAFLLLLKDAMKNSIGIVATGFAVLVMLAAAAGAAEIKVLSANGMQAVMEDLGPKFEDTTGNKLVITFATGGAVVKRAQDGEAIDVIVAPRQGADALVKAGKAAADDVTAVAHTGISVAIRRGAPKPDISSPEALRRSLLAANSITYLNPADGAASGVHFGKVLERLGITNEMKSKTVLAPKIDALGVWIANGEAEMGVLQFQLLFSMPGIEIVGPLPGDLQDTTVFAAVILPAAKDAAAAKALVDFLRTPGAAGVIKAMGMEPD
jgi:molybdate transport system substrate-binding protein